MSASTIPVRDSEPTRSSRLRDDDVISSVGRVRNAKEVGPRRMADALAHAFELWRDRKCKNRSAAIAEIAHASGYSQALLQHSVDALLKPFKREALETVAARVLSNRIERPQTVGFIAAGNVAGAGIHEMTIALIAGAGVVVKTASAEPVFFREFARTLGEVDANAGRRIEVMRWGRGRNDLTAALAANCDLVVAYGDDSTVAALRKLPNAIGFGSRVSAAIIDARALGQSQGEVVTDALARDVALFEQLGCLSLHHVFVLGRDADSRDFVVRMASALDRISVAMPPASVPLPDAAAIRSVRERARWRGIAGDAVELFEGRGLEWTVVFERNAAPFSISPGFRTLHVTSIRDLAEFRDCLASVRGRIEALAIGAAESRASELRGAAESLRIPYVCAPGEMQSPPLDWRHGGGEFLDRTVGTR